MRFVPAILLIVLAASPVWAQEYAAQEYTQPSPPQQVSGNYVGQPYYPAQPHYQQQPTQQAPVIQPHAGEHGQSVMTDIRQMNF